MGDVIVYGIIDRDILNMYDLKSSAPSEDAAALDDDYVFVVQSGLKKKDPAVGENSVHL